MTLEALEDGLSPGEHREEGGRRKSQVWGPAGGESTERGNIQNSGRSSGATTQHIWG